MGSYGDMDAIKTCAAGISNRKGDVAVRKVKSDRMM